MKTYRNKLKTINKFRAHDSKGVKKVFELKSGETMESDREVKGYGLEEIPEKTKQGDK
jgi:hypothetical protein